MRVARWKPKPHPAQKKKKNHLVSTLHLTILFPGTLTWRLSHFPMGKFGGNREICSWVLSSLLSRAYLSLPQLYQWLCSSIQAKCSCPGKKKKTTFVLSYCRDEPGLTPGCRCALFPWVFVLTVIPQSVFVDGQEEESVICTRRYIVGTFLV